MKKYIVSVSLSLVLFVPFIVMAQQADLRQQIAELSKPAKGIVGVSILGIESRDTLNYNGNARLVMQSVMKFPIALTIMHWVDTGKITLNQMVHITKKDLPKNYSPLRDKYPKADVDVSISDLLGYMVTQSDNDACDILIGVLKGPKTVQDYMLRSGIKNIAIRASEADMAASWELQYTDWCKPYEMTNLLDQFYTGKLLTKPSTDFLLKLMTDGDRLPRLKALLPAGTVVAHKTGSSGTSPEGLSPATNDVGIITLPNGKHLAISVFVCNSTADEATREGVISKIAKAVYDAYAK
jgi:beta-lactamase class A